MTSARRSGTRCWALIGLGLYLVGPRMVSAQDTNLRVGIEVAAPAPAHPAGPSASEPTADVVHADALLTVVGRTERHDTLSEGVIYALVDELLRALSESCRAVLEQAVETSVSAADWAEIASLSRDELQAALEAMASMPPALRTPRLQGLVREVTSTAMAESVVAKWLGHAPPNSQAPSAAASASFQLSAQMKAGDLRLDTSSAKLLQEVGGVATKNGLIDFGEWVQLELTFVNEGSIPWFSTSVFLSSADGCTWVDSNLNHELSEMLPGEAGSVQAWVFVSSHCPGGLPHRLHLRVQDTHRTRGRGEVVELTIRPLNSRSPRLVNRVFDVDEAGFSDGSGETRVSPGQRFELAVDVDTRSSAILSVATSYAFPGDLSGLFVSTDYRGEPLISGNGTIFMAADDLDIEVVGQDLFEAVLKGAALSKSWVRRERPVLWVAIDTDVSFVLPGGREPVRTETEVVTEPNCLDQEAIADGILGLIGRHVRLEPRPVATRRPEALVAASGYEVVFNEAGFRSDLDLLFGTSAVEEVVEEEEEEEGPAIVRSRFRHYHPLALTRVEEEPPPPVAAPARVAAPPRARVDETPRPARPVPEHFFKVDLGGSLLVYSVDSAAEGPSSLRDRTSVPLGALSLRLAVGRQLVGILAVEYGKRNVLSTSQGEMRFLQLMPEVGAGWVLTANQDLEFLVRATLGFRYRNIGPTDDLTTFYLSAFGASINIGSTFRYWLTPNIAAFADADILVGPPGTNINVGGISPRLSAGLTVGW